MRMPLPDLDYATLTVPANADFPAVVNALATVPGLEPQLDGNGNPQCVYRIDHDGSVYTLTYRSTADPAAVQATFTAVTPVPVSTTQGAVIDASLDRLRDGILSWDTDTTAARLATLKVAVRVLLFLARIARGNPGLDG